MIVQFDGNIVVTYQGSWVSTGPTTHWAGDWRMECTEGEILWTSRAGTPVKTAGDRVKTRKTGGKEKKMKLPSLPYTGRAGALAAFAQTVTSGKAPDYTSLGRDNIGSLRFMDAAVESAAVGRPVTLK